MPSTRYLLGTIAVLGLCGACGSGAPRPPVASMSPPPEPSAAVAPAPAPLPAAETIEAWIETVEVRVDRPTEVLSIPDGYARRGEGLTTWTSGDRRSVIVRYPHGVVSRATLEGPGPPPGVRPRLLPILHGGVWPHFGLLIDGWDVAVPMSPYGAGSLPYRVPLRRAPTDGAGALRDGAALEQTARLVHVSDCASEQEEDIGCMYYGAEPDLSRVEGRDVPGGWVLVRQSEGSPQAGAQWTAPEPYEREPGPLGLTLRTTEPGEGGGSSPRDITTRVLLRRGERLTHAFDLGLGSTLDEYGVHRGRVIDVDGILVVWLWIDGWEHAFSRHDPDSGERIGEPVLLGVSPHLGEAHGEPPDLYPVVEGSRLRFALILWEGSDALLFDGLGGEGRFVPVVLGSGDQLDGDGRLDDVIVSPFLRLERCGTSPCLRDPGSTRAATSGDEESG